MKRKPEDLYLDLSFPEPPRDRPYVFTNTVRTVDGRSDISGKSGAIGSDTDRTVMRNLRSLSDAVMIGSGTLLAEKVSLDIPEHLSIRRKTLGKSRRPLAVILSRNKDLPLDNLLDPEPGNTLVIGNASLDIGIILRFLKFQNSVQYLLVEGGSYINRSLQRAGVVDEIFLTIAPKFAGENHETLARNLDGTVSEAQPSIENLELLSTNIINSDVFLRYKVVCQ